MYILLFLILVLLLLAFGAHSLFGWALAETAEEGFANERRRERSFHDPRTWAAFRRWLGRKPPLLMSRRDRRGRFRKMS